jgi:hypothetical protein
MLKRVSIMPRILIAALLCALVGCQPTPAPIAAADMSHAPDSHVAASADPTHPSAPPPTRPSKDLDIPLLVPGSAIGPFKLGDTQEALVAAGHKLEAHPSGQLGDAVRVSGPYTLVFTDGAVSSIELALDQASARYKDQTLTGQDDVAALGKLLDCGPLEILEGGNVATCVEGLQLSQAGPVGLLSLRVSASR